VNETLPLVVELKNNSGKVNVVLQKPLAIGYYGINSWF